MRRLYRSRRERMVSGVAGGLAEYLVLDPSLVRIIWAVLAVVSGGILFLAYILMWIIVPEAPLSPIPAGESPGGGAAPEGAEPQPARREGASGVIFGTILIALGAYFLARELLPTYDLDRFWPLALVALGAVLLLAGIRRESS